MVVIGSAGGDAEIRVLTLAVVLVLVVELLRCHHLYHAVFRLRSLLPGLERGNLGDRCCHISLLLIEWLWRRLLHQSERLLLDRHRHVLLV